MRGGLEASPWWPQHATSVEHDLSHATSRPRGRRLLGRRLRRVGRATPKYRTRCTDAPAVERSKTALYRCDVHAGHLLRPCRPTAAMWKVLGAHVAGFHLNTPTPKLPPAALEGSSSALQPPPCGHARSSGAPEHGNGTSLHPPVVGAHDDRRVARFSPGFARALWGRTPTRPQRALRAQHGARRA